jgi:PAS domain-containing protein
MKSWTRNEIGLFDINLETGKCYWSFELKRMLGVRHDTPAEFHLLLQCIHPDDRRAFGRVAMQPFRANCPRHSSIEFRVVHNDGRVQLLHMERRAIVRQDDSEDVVRVLGFVMKISTPTGLLTPAVVSVRRGKESKK